MVTIPLALFFLNLFFINLSGHVWEDLKEQTLLYMTYIWYILKPNNYLLSKK
jgi:hypothetical protein